MRTVAPSFLVRLFVLGIAIIVNPVHAYISWTSAPSSVPSGNLYTIGAEVYDSSYAEQSTIDLYRGTNWEVGEAAYGDVQVSKSYTDSGPQSIGYSIDAYSYQGGYEWSSHTVTIQAPANNNPHPWVEADGYGHGWSVARPANGSTTVTIRFKATDSDGNLTGIRPQVWHSNSGYFSNNGGNFISQGGGSGEVVWSVTLNADGDWYFWTDAQDSTLAAANDWTNSGAWGSGFRLSVYQLANQPPDTHFDWSNASITNGQTLSGNGWAADPEDGAPVNRVEIFVDGVYKGNASLGGARGDVASYFGRGDYHYSGYSFGFALTGLSVGTHTVTARAVDNQSNYRDHSRTFNITNSAPYITLSSPTGQSLQLNSALQITSQATDADANLTQHNLDIRRPDGVWNWQGGFATGHPYTGGPVGSAGNSTRSAPFTFNQLGVWEVRAYAHDAGGAGMATPSVYISVTDSTASVPGNLNVTSISSSAFTLTWTAASAPSGISGYQVQLNGGTIISVSGLSHTFSGLSPSTGYIAQVRAVNGAGTPSAWTSMAATTGSGSTPPPGGGGGGNPSTSIWYDVDGDGIKDEVVKPGDGDFSYEVESWYTQSPQYANYNINLDWVRRDVGFDGQVSNDFSFVWWNTSYFWMNYTTGFQLLFQCYAPQNQPYKIYRDLSGLESFDPSRWGDPIFDYPGSSGGGTVYTTYVLPDSNELHGTQYFMVKRGLPIGSVRFEDSWGNTLLTDTLINGTGFIAVPSNGQISIAATNTGGNSISFGSHSLLWRILNAAGNLLRSGTGSMVDLNGIPDDSVQLEFILDSATPRRVNLEIGSVLVKKVEFTGSFPMTDYMTDFAGSGGSTFAPKGWLLDGANNPVAHVKGVAPSVQVTVQVRPAGRTFTLRGFGANIGLDFNTSSSHSSTGSDQVVTLQSATAFPARIDLLNGVLGWSATIDGQFVPGNTSGPHNVYLTWGSLGPGPTLKRVDWAVAAAVLASSPEEIAGYLYEMFNAHAKFTNGPALSWGVLDPTPGGDCDNIAQGMKAAFEMLGAGPAAVRKVKASTTAGAGNCLYTGSSPIETRIVNGEPEYLLLYFSHALPGDEWNAYEGCTEAAGKYYAQALGSELIGTNDYDVLQQLGNRGVLQRWVRTVNDLPPGPDAVAIEEILETVPIP